jgi:cytoskeletal protein CcmA (bactofilin family)
MTQDLRPPGLPKQSLAQRAARAFGLDAGEGGVRVARGLRRNDDEEIVPNTQIGVGTSFRGTLMIDGTLLVDGDFEGDILNCERIIVGPHGAVRSDVQVREAIVEGLFVGGIRAEERVVLLKGANVHGDLVSRTFAMEEGVRFTGQCTMIDDPEPGDEPVGYAARAGYPSGNG